MMVPLLMASSIETSLSGTYGESPCVNLQAYESQNSNPPNHLLAPMLQLAILADTDDDVETIVVTGIQALTVALGATVTDES